MLREAIVTARGHSSPSLEAQEREALGVHFGAGSSDAAGAARFAEERVCTMDQPEVVRFFLITTLFTQRVGMV